MNKEPEWLKNIISLPEINMNMKFFGGHQQSVPLGWKNEREAHFAFEIMIILDGVQQTKFDGCSFNCYQDDIILIPPGMPHENSCISPTGMHYFCVHFDIDDPEIQLNILMLCSVKLNKNNDSFPKIKSVLQKYITLIETNTFSLREKLMTEKLLIELMLSLYDYTLLEQNIATLSDNSSLILAKSIADTIQQNFRTFTKQPIKENQQLLSMHEIAYALNISESTMLKVFRKVYSISPKNYLDQLRYNELKFLLHQPNLPISEIAETIGYQNLSHFSRQFKQWSNLSPKEYRIHFQKNGR